jgi:hypothetical protein
MRITFREKLEDPAYPIMQGKSPIAKAFNKRQETIFKEGRFINPVDKEDTFRQITTVLLEIFADEYDKLHKPAKKIKEIQQ